MSCGNICQSIEEAGPSKREGERGVGGGRGMKGEIERDERETVERDGREREKGRDKEKERLERHSFYRLERHSLY